MIEEPDQRQKDTYQTPASRWEYWKWLVGVENQTDRKIVEACEASQNYLQEVESTTILQLKNRFNVLQHYNLYINAKKIENARITNNIISKIFFACISFLFKLIYKPSHLRGQLRIRIIKHVKVS